MLWAGEAMKREPKTATRKVKIAQTTKNTVPKGVGLKDYARRQAVLEGLLAGKPLIDIATKLELSREVVSRMIKTEDFKEELAELIAERRDRLSLGLEQLADQALTVHKEIMESTTHKQRLAAAEGILDRLSATQKRSTVKQQVTTAVSDEFASRSKEDLQHYVDHGYFPEDAPA
jgi:hypothetical protein